MNFYCIKTGEVIDTKKAFGLCMGECRGNYRLFKTEMSAKLHFFRQGKVLKQCESEVVWNKRNVTNVTL